MYKPHPLFRAAMTALFQLPAAAGTRHPSTAGVHSLYVPPAIAAKTEATLLEPFEPFPRKANGRFCVTLCSCTITKKCVVSKPTKRSGIGSLANPKKWIGLRSGHGYLSPIIPPNRSTIRGCDFARQRDFLDAVPRPACFRPRPSTADLPFVSAEPGSSGLTI